jgi:hypothetical protein
MTNFQIWSLSYLTFSGAHSASGSKGAQKGSNSWPGSGRVQEKGEKEDGSSRTEIPLVEVVDGLWAKYKLLYLNFWHSVLG